MVMLMSYYFWERYVGYELCSDNVGAGFIPAQHWGQSPNAIALVLRHQGS